MKLQTPLNLEQMFQCWTEANRMCTESGDHFHICVVRSVERAHGIVPEECPNCDSPLPEGCGGVFKDEGTDCRLNREVPPAQDPEIEILRAVLAARIAENGRLLDTIDNLRDRLSNWEDEDALGDCANPECLCLVKRNATHCPNCGGPQKAPEAL